MSRQTTLLAAPIRTDDADAAVIAAKNPVIPIVIGGGSSRLCFFFLEICWIINEIATFVNPVRGFFILGLGSERSSTFLTSVVPPDNADTTFVTAQGSVLPIDLSGFLLHFYRLHELGVIDVDTL
jgi:hypothetical protein